MMHLHMMHLHILDAPEKSFYATIKSMCLNYIHLFDRENSKSTDRKSTYSIIRPFHQCM